jgi:hypothetical protein
MLSNYGPNSIQTQHGQWNISFTNLLTSGFISSPSHSHADNKHLHSYPEAPGLAVICRLFVSTKILITKQRRRKIIRQKNVLTSILKVCMVSEVKLSVAT